MLTVLAITGAVGIAGTGAALILIWTWARQPVDAPEPWAPGELTGEQPRVSWTRWVDKHTGRQTPCPDERCRGRRCAGCNEPAQITAAPVPHVPRHDWQEIPPSLQWLAGRVHVTFRGALITAELVGRHVTRPADGVAFRLWAARKLGRPLQLGTHPMRMLP